MHMKMTRNNHNNINPPAIKNPHSSFPFKKKKLTKEETKILNNADIIKVYM